MGVIGRWTRRLHRLLNAGAVERAMDAEMQFHLEHEAAEAMRAGLSPEDARREAIRRFGSVERVKEEAREARGTRWAEDSVRDVRYASRVLRGHPAFTAAMVATFALGLGAATAMFTVVYGVLLRPLPYATPDRLLVLWERDTRRSNDRNVVSWDSFEAWRTRAHSFEEMAALVPRPATLVTGHAPERIIGAEVSPTYFRLLGVRPIMGRDFEPRDGQVGAAPVALVSHGLWSRRFGSDPSVVGRPLHLAGDPRTIIGVMPADFDPPRFGWLGTQQMWVPLVPTEQSRAWGRYLLVVGRLKPAATLDGANAELVAIARALEQESPANEGWSAAAVPLNEQLVGEVRQSLLLVSAASILLLSMAVTNVTLLTLSFMNRRRHEITIRRSLGATDGRLFRQLLVQSLIVGVLGTLAGLAIAVPVVRLLRALMPPDMPRTAAIALDMPVLVASSVIAAAATVAFGAFAARRDGRLGALPISTTGSGRTVAATGGKPLIVAEVAAGLALAIVALLMVRSYQELRAVQLGFDPEGVLVARVELASSYDTPQKRRLFFDELLERVRTLPAITDAGLVSGRPLGGIGPATALADPAEKRSTGEEIVADIRFADAGYFRTVRIPLLNGALHGHQHDDAEPQVLVNQTAAHVLWGGKPAVGRRVSLAMFGGITAQVIGIVGDVHLMDVRTSPRPTAYLSTRQFPDGARDLVVRTAGQPDAVVPALRTVLARMDSTVPLARVSTLSGLVSEALAPDQFTTALLGAFASVALLLAGTGIFGVSSNEVEGRRREIAIRLALGARPRAVLLQTVGHAASRAILGIVLGAALGYAMARAMAPLLFGVQPFDAVSFLLMTGLVLAIVTLASLIPSIRAMRETILTTLRES